MAKAADPGTPGATRRAVVNTFPPHNVDKPHVLEISAEPKQYWLLGG